MNENYHLLPPTHQQLSLPAFHPVLQPYLQAFTEIVKPAWLLKCHSNESVLRTQSHVGGSTPFMPQAEGWPLCPCCTRPLTFVIQINFAEFETPILFASKGLWQFFYCWHTSCCFIPGEKANQLDLLTPLSKNGPYSTNLFCRWYPEFDQQTALATPQAPCPCPQEDILPLFIIESVPFLSFPSYGTSICPLEDLDEEEIVEKTGRRLWAIYSYTEGIYLEGEMISRVGGYAPWIQDIREELPSCPVCGQEAEFVAALGSDDNTALIWGDSGYWYIYACQATAQCYGLNRPLMEHASL